MLRVRNRFQVGIGKYYFAGGTTFDNWPNTPCVVPPVMAALT
jgi:hypothetical protein